MQQPVHIDEQLVYPVRLQIEARVPEPVQRHTHLISWVLEVSGDDSAWEVADERCTQDLTVKTQGMEHFLNTFVTDTLNRYRPVPLRSAPSTT